MLQYPVQLPPLSLSSSPTTKNTQRNHSPTTSDYVRPNDLYPTSQPRPLTATSNKQRFSIHHQRKESFSSPRSAFNALPPPFLPPSPNILSPPLPHHQRRPSYTLSSRPSSRHSSRPTSSAFTTTNLTATPATSTSDIWSTQPKKSSFSSSVASSNLVDVLLPGDFVGEGGTLQGETISLVPLTGANASNKSPLSLDYQEPAQEFQVKRTLGHGSYAVVYLVQEVLYRPQHSEDGHGGLPTIGLMDSDSGRGTPPPTDLVYGREYAIKCLSKANLDEDELAAQMSEVTIHQSLRLHPNIVALHRTLETPSVLLLLLEYVPGEDLFYFLEQSRDQQETSSPLATVSTLPAPPSSATTPTSATEGALVRTPPTPSLLGNTSQLLSRTRLRLIASMFSQMCDAVSACHAQQVFHRDIKPENFIVTDGWVDVPGSTTGRQERKVIVKLSDFGLSTTDVSSSDMDCGSAPYMSYECRNNVAPTYRPRAADVWSLGIVLINMLYHVNPWTDTAEGACSSFELYRKDSLSFFLNRFPGMTRTVADYLTSKIFCILDADHYENDSARATAAEFGQWSRNLPALLGGITGHGMQRTVSGSSSKGHPIAQSTPMSHRPCSRHPSGSTTAGRTPAMPTRSLSRAPSLAPAYEGREHSGADLSTVFDHEPEPELDEPVNDHYSHQVPLLLEELEEEQEQQDEGTESRSPSTTKRRKRGARKGKGTTAMDAISITDETLTSLADASQSLAREISKASRSSSVNRSVMSSSKSIKSAATPSILSTTTSSKGSSLTRKEPSSFEPISLHAIPSALLTPATHNSSSRAPLPPSPSSPKVTSPPTSAHARASPSPVTKKPSKWKLSFGKNSAPSTNGAGRVSPVEEYVPAMTTTASNVSSLIMGLNAPAPPLPHDNDDAMSTWSRGRKNRSSPLGGTVNGSRGSLVPGSPERSSEHDQRWAFVERHSERAISPNSTRSGRPLASSASSVASSNWRSSMSTTSSAGTSTSAFTRYSNSSTRSVSTTATSVSAASWRTNPNSVSSKATTGSGGYAAGALPRNIKLMTGVPWELDEVPRGQYLNSPSGDIFGSPPGPRKQRTRKPKDGKLEPINERPGTSAFAFNKGANFGGVAANESVRRDAATSTTDLSGLNGGKDEIDGVKKVQKGQINALAKMLSALRR